MTLRRIAILAALCFTLATSHTLTAAEYTTENFIVYAPNEKLAKQFGEYAEKYREEKAMEWLGKKMPRWSEPCPLRVKVTMNKTGGATTFTFSNRARGVQSQEMEIFGDVPQLLNSVLPHEVTHTVLAYHFGQPVPRWADEGGSVLSENEKERYDHDIKCREFLNQGRGITLSHLFPMSEYPRDMIVLYAQGYSVSQYLIDLGGGGLKGRQKFLEFIETGMKSRNRNWDAATKLYGFKSVEDLEEKWIDSLRKPPVRLASRGGDSRTPTSQSSLPKSDNRGTETRTSAVAALPMLEPPVFTRGATPSYDDRSTLRPVAGTSYPAPQPLTPPALTPTAPTGPSLRVQHVAPGTAPVPVLLPPELPSK
jgi:hypothetical protein